MVLSKAIDINCDLGEGMPNDAEIMPFISSVNIACGGHYGDQDTMRTAIILAKKHGVKIGAHPSFPDRIHFGRKVMNLSLKELEQTLWDQINSFLDVCNQEEVVPNHIKLHGALYNLSATDLDISNALFNVLQSFRLPLEIYAPNKYIISKVLGKSYKIRGEAFIDRRYEKNGNLVARSLENALISNQEDAWQQLKKIYVDGRIESITGEMIDLEAQTFCIHGDSPNVLHMIRHITHCLKKDGIRLQKDE